VRRRRRVDDGIAYPLDNPPLSPLFGPYHKPIRRPPPPANYRGFGRRSHYDEVPNVAWIASQWSDANLTIYTTLRTKHAKSTNDTPVRHLYSPCVREHVRWVYEGERVVGDEKNGRVSRCIISGEPRHAIYRAPPPPLLASLPLISSLPPPLPGHMSKVGVGELDKVGMRRYMTHVSPARKAPRGFPIRSQRLSCHMWLGRYATEL
jgi:hypothetical protein